MNYLIQAEDILDNSTWWFGNINDKQRGKAIDLLNSAVIEFKLNKDYHNAANTLKKIALLQQNNDYGKYNIAINYHKAGEMYELVDIKAATSCYIYAIPLYVDLDKLDMAASLSHKVADYYYEDRNFIDALKYYEMTNTYKEDYRVTLSIYDLYIRLHHYNKAIGILYTIIDYYIKMKEDPIVFLFDFGILRIYANNIPECKKFLRQYDKFNSVELTTLYTLIDCLEKGDKMTFITTQNNYHNTFTLKPWHIGLLDQVHLRF
jgi:tetratricopeptide (TPR) repeat protein